VTGRHRTLLSCPVLSGSRESGVWSLQSGCRQKCEVALKTEAKLRGAMGVGWGFRVGSKRQQGSECQDLCPIRVPRRRRGRNPGSPPLAGSSNDDVPWYTLRIMSCDHAIMVEAQTHLHGGMDELSVEHGRSLVASETISINCDTQYHDINARSTMSRTLL
jgi:hypothetical protein